MEKGSKFYAFLVPVTNEADVQTFLLSIKKSHPKARHFCTALRLGPEVSIERSNDDGEPAGSAGKPILGQLIKHDLTNIVVVVVRYFGGTKLGIPGLIEAYKTSTASAIANARIISQTSHTVFQVTMKYELFSSFKNHLLQAGVPLYEEQFSDIARIKVGFKKTNAEFELMTLLKNYSGRDFDTLKEYADYLEFVIVNLREERVSYSGK